MRAGSKWTLVSGSPWWFDAAFLMLGGFFGIIGVVMGIAGVSWAPLLTVGAIIIGFILMRLIIPNVYLGDGCLYVSRMFRRATIPLEHVAHVQEPKPSWPFGVHWVVIHFTTDTPLGRFLYLGAFDSIPGMIFPSALEDLKQALTDAATKRSNHAMERTTDRRARHF